MTSLQYHRPRTLDEALKLLKDGVPLAGGTRLTPSLRGVGALIDLQDLNLDQIEVTDETLSFGGTTTLQTLVANAARLPEDLARAARLEAGWNIRNKATVAGTIVTGDGRSPLLTVLLAMGTELEFAPGEERASLEEVLARGTDRTEGKLITAIRTSNSEGLRYEQVARSPADRPLVCAAIDHDEGPSRVALGGFGAYPQLAAASDAQEAAELAQRTFAEADDQWASAEYRASAAAKLVARMLLDASPK